MARVENPRNTIRDPNPGARDEAAGFAALTGTLEEESRLMRELTEALLKQRAAVASRDVETVDTETTHITRVLEEVGKTQARRQEMLRALGGDARSSLRDMESRTGVPLPPSVQHARAGLAQAAREANHQLVINDAVLRRAVETETDFLKTVFSSLEAESPSYRPRSHGAAEAGPGSVLLNKVA